MTQCILSHILASGHRLGQDRLEQFYEDCLDKDEQLDELAAEEQQNNLERRHLGFFPSNNGKDDEIFRSNRIELALFAFLFEDVFYQDPYIPLIKSDNGVVRLGNHYGVPLTLKEFRPIEVDIMRAGPQSMAAALAQAIATEQAIEEANRFNDDDYLDSEELMVKDDRPSKFIIEEANMSKQSKRSGIERKCIFSSLIY